MPRTSRGDPRRYVEITGNGRERKLAMAILWNGACLLAVVLAVMLMAPLSAQAAEGEPYAEVDPDDSWAFEPVSDAFTDRSLLDLRSLNESVAGEHGFVRLSEDGMSFVRGDGEPIRFWAIITRTDMGASKGMNLEQARSKYRFLAKRGVNMARLFTGFFVAKEGAKITDVNDQAIEVLHRHVAACRENGVYMTICPYWAHLNVPESWGLEGATGKMPWGLLFLNPKLQEAYKSWIREAYTRVNPHTGLAIRDDPAVAILQVHNEDSMFFWTTNGIPPEQMRILEARYADWLKEKYGSLEQALKAWDGFGAPDDDVAGGILGWVSGRRGIIWELTQDRSGPVAKRLRDQTEFLARLQHDFYAEMNRYMKEDLGCKQLTNGSNWRTASLERLDDLDRWTCTACDVMARNDYTGGVHVGTNNGYRIDPGHYLVSQSVTRNALNLPTHRKQVIGAPMIVTETAWVHPNLYQTEGPMLGAAYLSLSGVDALYWFDVSEESWTSDPRRLFWRVGDEYALAKWNGNVPQEVGMFPANALLFRLGYLKQGAPAVIERRTLESLLHRVPAAIGENKTYDPIRDAVDERTWDTEGAGDAVSRLAYLVGPVLAEYGAKEDSLKTADLGKFIDTKRKVVRSITGELAMDYRDGLFTMDAPKAQGVAGFLREAGGKFELGDVTIESTNRYAAIQLVSMDTQPLAQSGKVLIQVGTLVRPAGWTVRDAAFKQGENEIQGQQIVTTGGPPYRIANTHATITVRNPRLSKATLLDIGGYAAGEVAVRKGQQGLVVELPPNAMYVVLE
jgi:hypothetical protein